MTQRWVKIWTRDEWQTKRNNFHVKKGATKVSMGAALEKFHKANNASVDKGIKALPALKKAVAQYKIEIAAKNEDLAEYIQKNLEPYIKEYERDAPKFAKVAQTYPVARAHALAAMRDVGEDLVQWRAAGKQGTFTPRNGKAAGGFVEEFLKQATLANFATDAIKDELLRKLKTSAQQAANNNWSEKGTDGIMEAIAEMPDYV